MQLKDLKKQDNKLSIFYNCVTLNVFLIGKSNLKKRYTFFVGVLLLSLQWTLRYAIKAHNNSEQNNVCY